MRQIEPLVDASWDTKYKQNETMRHGNAIAEIKSMASPTQFNKFPVIHLYNSFDEK